MDQGQVQMLAAVLGIVAAGFWMWATAASVPHVEHTDEHGWTDGSIGIDGKDLIPTLQLQGRLNAVAAFVTGLAAFVQAVSFWVPPAPAPPPLCCKVDSGKS